MDGQSVSFFKGKGPFAIILASYTVGRLLLVVKGPKTMTKRNDIHAPAAIDPALYTYERTVDLKGPSISAEMRKFNPAAAKAIEDAWSAEYDALIERCKGGGHTGNFLNKGTCDHCGAYFIYGAEFRHENGEHIVVGHVCADKTLGECDRRTLDRKRVAAARKTTAARVRNETWAAAYVIEHNFTDAFSEARRNTDSWGGGVLADMYERLGRYGRPLSEKQLALVAKIVTEMDTPAQTDCDFCGEEGHTAKDCTNRHPVPVTDARIEINAIIRTVRYEEGQYGTQVKALYETVDGFRLWGTVPASLFDALRERSEDTVDDYEKAFRGVEVNFFAKVTRSDKDATFGFINRPTKASIVDAGTIVFNPCFPEPTVAGDKSDAELTATLIAARKAL